MMSDNKIIIRSVFKITRCKMNPAINSKTNRYAVNVRRVDSNGDMILLEGDKNPKNEFEIIGETDIIEIYDGKIFDLDDKTDKSQWEAIKDSPLIAEERWARDEKGELIIDGSPTHYGAAEFYIDRPGKESQTSNSKAQLVYTAQGHIFQDSRDGLYIKARILGARLNGLPYDDVLDFMLKEAVKNPKKIIELYIGADFKLKVLLVTALDKGVILERNGGYIYGKQSIGITEESVFLWMKQPQNKDILDSITAETFPETYSTEAQKEERIAFKKK